MANVLVTPSQSRGMRFGTQVLLFRLSVILTALVCWEALSRSGLLFQDVVPSLVEIAGALIWLFQNPAFYANLGVTAWEIGVAISIGGAAGLFVGIVLGSSPFLARTYEPFLFYLGPTPKIIFFPLLIMWFGVGPGSKVALGAVSCFFPIAISTAAGIRSIDSVLIRVGRSFGVSRMQMITKIYFPAIRIPAINGLRLGLGIAIIGTVLAETKLSNQGIGYMVIQTYTTFDMPRMYALLITLFVAAIGLNALIDKFGRSIRG